MVVAPEMHLLGQLRPQNLGQFPGHGAQDLPARCSDHPGSLSAAIDLQFEHRNPGGGVVTAAPHSSKRRKRPTTASILRGIP